MSFYIAFVYGPAAAGKHTVGTLVSARLGIPLFHNHLTVDLVKTLFEFGTAPFNQLRQSVWLSAFAAAAQHGRSFVFTFNPEVTVDPELIPRLQQTIEQHGGQVLYIELQCSDKEVARRIGNASRQQFGKLTDPQLYHEIKSRGGFDFPPLPTPLLTIDTELHPPEAATDRIITAIREHLQDEQQESH